MGLSSKLLTGLLATAIAFPGFAKETSSAPEASASKSGAVPHTVQFLSFAAFDTNKDGYLSQEETKAIIREPEFAVADVNGDGRLDPVEFAMEPKQVLAQ
jgi:hypothetical protein